MVSLEAENLNFGYNSKRWVIQALSVSVVPGSILAILGPSGCGKTTFLRIVAGLLPSEASQRLEGTVRINGSTASQFRKKNQIGIVFQDVTLLPHLTVRDNISLPLWHMISKPNVDEVISLLGLSDVANCLPRQLSGGMKTRTALGRALAANPKLLLLDEPFASLDVGWRQQLLHELSGLLRRTGATVLLIAHEIREALSIANQIIVLDQYGRLALHEGDIEKCDAAVLEERALAAIMSNHPARLT